MTREELLKNIKKKRSFLCIGLDTDLTKIPKHLLKLDDPIFEFNKQIIDATKDLCVAYKPNTAFYESEGLNGWEALEKTINYIRKNYPDVFTIADAKRGDIGNTSRMYAKAFFEKMNFDAITVAPYMGEDSVTPFLEYKNKWVIVLAATSNEGASDFQGLTVNGRSLSYKVVESSKKWGNAENMMYVVGATRPDEFQQIRAIIPDHFLLVPGVGAQGGSLEEVAKYGMSKNKQCGLLVNASRSIIYAGTDNNFAEKARDEATTLQKRMDKLLQKNGLV